MTCPHMYVLTQSGGYLTCPAVPSLPQTDSNFLTRRNEVCRSTIQQLARSLTSIDLLANFTVAL